MAFLRMSQRSWRRDRISLQKSGRQNVCRNSVLMSVFQKKVAQAVCLCYYLPREDMCKCEKYT